MQREVCGSSMYTALDQLPDESQSTVHINPPITCRFILKCFLDEKSARDQGFGMSPLF